MNSRKLISLLDGLFLGRVFYLWKKYAEMKKNHLELLLFFLSIIIMVSCSQEPTPNVEGTGEQSPIPGKMIIAEGFRSEALIEFPEEDEMWRGKIDQHILVNAIFDAIYEGRVKPYDFITDDPLTIEDVKAIESSIDTIYMEDFETGEIQMKVLEDELRRDEITKVFFKEDWYFDTANFKMEKKVIGISLAIESYDSSGNLRGYEPLFIVYFDERYPLSDEGIL